MKPTAARLLLLFLVLAAVAAGFCACATSNAASSPESDKAVLMTAAGYDTGEAGADAPRSGRILARTRRRRPVPQNDLFRLLFDPDARL